MEQSRWEGTSQVSNLTMPPLYEQKLRSPFLAQEGWGWWWAGRDQEGGRRLGRGRGGYA